MLPYLPILCTLDYVRAHRKLGDTTLGKQDDALLAQFTESASALFQAEVNRIFVPYYGAQPYDYQSSLVLDVDDVLELVSVTNGDGVSMDLSKLLRIPANDLPTRRLQVSRNGGTPFVFNAEPLQAISITAWRGCVPHYATTAFASTATVPTGDLASGATSVTFAADPGLEIGAYLLCEDEMMRTTSRSDNRLTYGFARAELGTTTAAHTVGTALEVFTPLGDVREAVRQLAVYFYLHKDSIGTRTTVISQGVVVAEDVDPIVQRTLDRYNLNKVWLEVIN